MTVLITGGAGGIGAEISRCYSKAGYNVAINYNKSESAALELVEEIIQAGGKAKAYKADVSSSREVDEMVVSIIEDMGHVDVLVNNAAVAAQNLLTDVTDAEFDKIMNTNVKGVFNVSRAVLPGMIHRKSGCIINISSMWGQVGASCEVVYSASKAAVIGFTQALAKEVGPSGVRVNCIAPGVIDTPMNAGHSAETMKELCNETPLSRIGLPEDIAKGAYFLSSEDASFITGQVFGINGGFVI